MRAWLATCVLLLCVYTPAHAQTADCAANWMTIGYGALVGADVAITMECAGRGVCRETNPALKPSRTGPRMMTSPDGGIEDITTEFIGPNVGASYLDLSKLGPWTASILFSGRTVGGSAGFVKTLTAGGLRLVEEWSQMILGAREFPAPPRPGRAMSLAQVASRFQHTEQ